MKKLLPALCVPCALAEVAHAEDTTTTTPDTPPPSTSTTAKKKHGMTEEQKALSKEMVAKYDTNKNGRLDKSEREAMSAEDKAKMEKAGLISHKHSPTSATKDAETTPKDQGTK